MQVSGMGMGIKAHFEYTNQVAKLVGMQMAHQIRRFDGPFHLIIPVRAI